tara:strand:+ start:582 stop:2186 length:1605 start_codon:yes stop_codon:yes gene_type:complete
MSDNLIKRANSVSFKDSSLFLNDGVELVSRIWTPEGKGPWPALLMRQPYGREIASTVTYLHPSWWASHGYLVIIQDVRGQGSSSGEFTGFRQEASDTSQTHLWIRSLNECNGRLGTYGFSYQGLTQLLADPGTPPPDCLIPAMTGLDEKNHWSAEGNAFWWDLGITWGLQLAAMQAKKKKDFKSWEKIRKSLEENKYLRDGPQILKETDPEGMAYQWLSNANKTHSSFTVHKPLKSWLKQPILLLGGWWDPHLKGIIDLYQKSIIAGGNPDIYIGPATHLEWWKHSQKIQLKFFNKHLKNQNNERGFSSKKRFWNISKKKWEDNKSLAKDIEPHHFWGLSANGMACLDDSDGKLNFNSNGQGEIQIVHDPWRPVPSKGGHLGPRPGKANRCDIDLRGDVATFTSNPLLKKIRLKGFPILELYAEADRKTFDICVALSIVRNNKTNVDQISTGFLRLKEDETVISNKRIITLQPVLTDINKGEHLRISISGSAWPAIGINPGDPQYPCGPSSPHCLVINLSLKLSESNLHVIPLI